MPRRRRCMAFASLLTGAGALGALHCGSFDSESSKTAEDGGGDVPVAVDGTNDAPAIDAGCGSSTDPKNCGACGLSCEGAAKCVAGGCEPITYTTFPGGEATVLSYAAGGLYWLDKVKNKVGACEGPVVPCLPRDLADAPSSADIYATATNVFWTQSLNGETTGDYFHRYNRASGGIDDNGWTNFGAAGELFNGRGIGAIGATVLVADNGASAGGNGDLLKACLEDGGSCTTVGLGRPNLVATTPSGAFVIGSGAPYPVYFLKTFTGPAPTPAFSLDASPGPPLDLATQGERAYFTSGEGISSIRCPPSGCTRSILVPSDKNATAIAADGSGVYWVTSDGRVRWMAEPEQLNATVVDIMTNLPKPKGLALSEKHVYVGVEGRILRVPKRK